jgi:hypothetical protein
MSATYGDIGPAQGSCSNCGREAYAVPGSMTVKLVMSDQTDKIKATAMWCSMCDKLYCMGCGNCAACNAETHDHYNRT